MVGERICSICVANSSFLCGLLIYLGRGPAEWSYWKEEGTGRLDITVNSYII